VSVLVAVHDRGQDAVEALTSVAASLYDALEVLVLHDTSNDPPVSALRRFLGAWVANRVGVVRRV
jgi:hypothetical protein